MQERHNDRRRYFEEQAQTCRKYYIPFLAGEGKEPAQRVLEVGCGEGGNLLPFAKRGCEAWGIDLAACRVDEAKRFFAEHGQTAHFVCGNVLQRETWGEAEEHVADGTFDLVLLHDVIEHIDAKEEMLRCVHGLLAADGVAFVGFPAWQMPFGGHQQIARGRMVAHAPFIHLLPRVVYRGLLKLCGEREDVIRELMSIKNTRCTIEHFRRAARSCGFEIVKQQLWLVNPHYETKFGMRPRRLSRWVSRLPWLRNFFSTSCWYVLRPVKTPA